MKCMERSGTIGILRGGVRTWDHVQRIIVEYHSRELLSQVREILARQRFSEENDRRLLP
jgi:hypothetical protein